MSISKKAIDDSIMTRLYDYIYDVRKAVTNGKISKDIKKRWPKFIRLSLYLIDPQLKYPNVLQISDKELNKYLNKHHIKLKNKKLLLNYETVWEKVLSKKNVI